MKYMRPICKHIKQGRASHDCDIFITVLLVSTTYLSMGLFIWLDFWHWFLPSWQPFSPPASWSWTCGAPSRRAPRRGEQWGRAALCTWSSVRTCGSVSEHPIFERRTTVLLLLLMLCMYVMLRLPQPGFWTGEVWSNTKGLELVGNNGAGRGWIS